MGKRKDQSGSDEESIMVLESTNQRHKQSKKHKHKRHKRKREAFEEYDSDASIDVSLEDGIDKTAFKIKSKVNKEMSASAADILKAQTQKTVIDVRKISVMSPASSLLPKAPAPKKKKVRGRDSATSSEEERWLDAIESGKLEEVDDELKKIKPKDPKMMTARQRAMYERGTDKEPSPGGEVLLALPSGYKEKVMTEEAIQKAALKSQKRKQLADEKREKDKKKTMERLLKKQESKAIKGGLKNKLPARKAVPLVMYKNTAEKITLSFPSDIPFPIATQISLDPPKPIKCAISTCCNLKKYNCSQTGMPLCSLECYKRNLQRIGA